MKRSFFTFGMLFLLALTMSLSPFLFSKVQVGEVVQERFESEHPYKGVKGVVWKQEFHWPEAGYIAIHFSNFDLANGDFIEISSPDDRFKYQFWGKGKKVKQGTESISEFWATHIPGDRAIVKLVSKNKKNGYGFVIDKWAHGYERGYIEAVMTSLEEDAWANFEAICSSDDKEWAKCYQDTTMYNKARAVCRLLIHGTGLCTGWLLGSEGHVMTNNHCIWDPDQANNTDFEFMAEGATCTTNCANPLACPGTVAASAGTLIKTDSTLDYSLILLPTNVTSTYGYLQFRDTLPTIGERIYIPQHPRGYGKQLAVNSDVDGGFAKIYSTNQTPCHGGGPDDIGYYADTEPGSSGSPVLAYSDHLVVALHHCGTCPNRGVPISSIISHLGPDLPNNAIHQTPTITVISPKRGSNWKIGNKYTITWNSSNVTGDVRIQLFKGTTRLGNITNRTANDGRFAWTIGTLTNGYQVEIPASNYRVKIRAVNDSTIWDFSGYFTISDADPKIAIVDKTPPTFGHTVDKGTIITDTFRVKNIGGGTLNFSVSDDRTWISVSPTSGSCASQQKSNIITVTITTSGLAYGSDNSGTITVSDPNASNSPQTISVTVSVRDLVKCKLYRYLNSSIGDHYYTINWNELGNGAGGYVYEGVACYVCGSQQPGTVPLYRYLNNTIGDHFYTKNWNELGNGAGGYIYEGIACWVHNSQQPGTKKFYRYLNSSIGDHYYTTNWNELGNGAGGYVYEGVACFVY